MRPRGPGNEDGPREDACGREALGTRMGTCILFLIVGEFPFH